MHKYAEHLNLLDLSVRTIIAYYRDMRLVFEYFDKNPAAVTQYQLRSYIMFVKNEKRWAPKTLRQSIASAKRFYCDMLGKKWKLWDIVSVRDKKSLPVVLTPEEVRRIFSCISLLRYKVPLELIYTCGLRLNEAVSLKVHHIERDNNRIVIRNGKGGKDRYIPLSKWIGNRLMFYWQHHKNPLWLFPQTGRGSGNSQQTALRMHTAQVPMQHGSLQTTFRKARLQAAINKEACIHTLRHSYATHLLAMGVNIRQLQTYLGHDSIETTTIYTHLVPYHEQETLKLIEALTLSIH